MTTQLARSSPSRVLFILALALLAWLPPTAQGQILQSWGLDGSGQVANTPITSGFSRVAGGGFHSLALKSDGSIVAWGSDVYGQVSGVPSGTGHLAIAAGWYHSVALLADGSISSWGRNDSGQISGTPAGSDFIQVAAGQRHSIALRADGSITAWGADWHGAVSNAPSGTGYTQVAAGGQNCLALRADGSIEAWGWDGDGQVSNTPSGTGFVELATGFYGSLAMKTDGSLVAWGSNSTGHVTDTPSGTGFTGIAMGDYHSLALRSNGSIAAWGSDSDNQVSTTPSGTGFTHMSGGGLHSVAVRTALPPQPVHNISGPTLATFSSIQAAVDAAGEGDVLLVGEGDGPFGGFVIDGKSVSVIAHGAPVIDIGVGYAIEVRNLSPQQRVVVSGFTLEDVVGNWSWSGGGMRLEQNAGHVFIQDTEFNLYAGNAFVLQCDSPMGVPTVQVVDSDRVAFSDCSFQGRGGSHSDDLCSDLGAYSTPGSAGISCVRSRAALYGCLSTGGEGGGSSATGSEPGGAGLDLVESTAFLLDTRLQGGVSGTDDGGSAWGAGVAAAQLDASSVLHYIDCQLLGGWGATVGPATSGGSVDSIPGVRRMIESLPMTSWTNPGDATLRGVNGDIVFFLTSPTPKFRWLVPLGVQQLDVALPLNAPVGTIGGTGSLVAPLDFSNLALSVAPGPVALQGFTLGANGTRHLSGVRHVLAIDPATLPDCNANGVNDYLDILSGTSVDSNHNLVPDECGS